MLGSGKFDLIGHRVLEESHSVKEEDKTIISSKVLAEVDQWIERFDCVVIGPCLGRDPFLLDCMLLMLSFAKQIGVTILQKGKSYLISNGDIVKLVSICGSPRRYVGFLEAGIMENIREGVADVQPDFATACFVQNGKPQRPC